MRKLLMVLMLLPLHVWAQKTTGEKALVITKMAAKYHVEPKSVNDSFSLTVYHAVLDKLDPYHIFLSSDDVQQLTAFKFGIDEEIQQQSTRFVQAAGTVLSKALLRSEQTAQSLLQKPFSFTVKEYFPLKLANGVGIPAAQLRPRLQLYLKWRMLQQMSEVWMDDSVGLSQEILTKVDTVLRKEMSEKLTKKWKQFATDTAQFNNWIAATYLNVIATTYDPHTEYMSSEDKYALDEELSSESMEFGFGLDVDEEGNYKIDDVVPGSAAWKSSNIHEGDQIIAIKPEGGASISLRDASPEQIAEILNKYADKAVEFTVKSADGTIRTVKLNKQPIRNEENVVRGWILEGDKKIGIISLPSFYTQMDNGTGTSCAEDMAREIVKLKQEKIDGLIVDLRFNGGGSLEEAAAMLGIFVDIGPLGMIKLYDGSFETIKDVNRGFIYDGPLVIMVNGASASASEILAGTLQDYKKAIIAGSTTFGKATMQVVLPLDSTLDLLKYAASKPAEPDPLQDYLKITIGKLYRVNGSTAQNIGVVPEVHLPDFFEAVDYTERSYPTSLKADSVPSKLVYRASPQKVSKTVLEDFEKTSVQTDPEFIETQRLNRMQKLTNLAKQIPLKLAEYNEWYSSGYSDKSEMVADKKQENVAPFKVRNTRQDADYNAMDSFQKENDEAIIQELTDDASIKQVYLLIKKMLETLK